MLAHRASRLLPLRQPLPLRRPLPLAAARRLLSKKATGSQEGVESLKSANPAVAAQQLAGEGGAPEVAAAEGEDPAEDPAAAAEREASGYHQMGLRRWPLEGRNKVLNTVPAGLHAVVERGWSGKDSFNQVVVGEGEDGTKFKTLPLLDQIPFLVETREGHVNLPLIECFAKGGEKLEVTTSMRVQFVDGPGAESSVEERAGYRAAYGRDAPAVFEKIGQRTLNPYMAVHFAAQEHLTTELGQVELDEAAGLRDRLQAEARTKMEALGDDWGLAVRHYEIKSIEMNEIEELAGVGGDTVAAYLAARQSNKAHSTADQERADQKAEEERLAALSAEEAAAEAAEAAAAAEAEAKAAAEAEAALQKEAEEAAAQAEAEAEAKRKEEEEEAAAAEAEAQAEVETDADDEKPQEVEVEAEEEEEEEEEDRGPPPEPAELPPLPEGMADIPELQAQAATLRTVLQVSESWPGIVAVGDFTTALELVGIDGAVAADMIERHAIGTDEVHYDRLLAEVEGAAQ